MQMQYRAGEIAAYTEIGRALRHGGCRCRAPLAVTKVLMDEIAGRMTQDEFFALAIRLTAPPELCSGEIESQRQIGHRWIS